jgi:pyruvate,orthophosphate dikinase
MTTHAPTRATSAIYAFDDPLPEGFDPAALLGGKGAGLAEMTQQLGLPVPPGFVITTEVCREYLANGWPAGLDEAIRAHLAALGARTGHVFGDPENPLLVSVRSGAPVSMPGMMDTLLNVGAAPGARERVIAGGRQRFAADTWLRFSRMYAEIVLGLPREDVSEAAESDGTPEGFLAAADRVHELARPAGGIPEQPFDQLRGAIEAVFRSWGSERARVFRSHEGISEELGTAVTVQAMVFGNVDANSGTGVVFTRDPATGAAGPFGDYLACAQGEDVVAGTHSVGGLSNLREQLPGVYDELLAILDRLERHYRDMCDVEFTVHAGRLYILQTRIGRRSPLAAVRIAVAMAEDPGFPVSKADAVARVDAGVLQQLASQRSVDPSAQPVATGLAASPGVAAGVLCCDPDRAADLASKNIACVLARAETSPSDVHGMIGAAALVTTLGGVASHAAVVARGWGIPAVTSLNGATVLATGMRVGDQFIAEGEVVTVDGGTGAFYLGDRVAGESATIPELISLRRWAAELDAEPGTASEPGDPGRSSDVTLLELARTVQLKGLCAPERAAAALSAALDRIEELVAGHDHVFKPTPRGVMLTPDGRSWLSQELESERMSVDSQRMNTCYGQFMELNHGFKQLVSEWQLKQGSDPTDADWDNVVTGVASIHEGLAPLLEDACGLAPRLRSYTGRFIAALEAMRAGDRTMLASPLKDSYHTVWFEYHEELITLCGRDRAEEEKNEGH